MKEKKYKKILLYSLLGVLVLFLIFIFLPKNEIAKPSYDAVEAVAISGYYSDYQNSHQDSVMPSISYIVPADEFVLEEGFIEDDYYHWEEDVFITINVDIATTGWYLVYFNYQSNGLLYMPTELSVLLNGTSPFHEANQISLDNLWEDDIETLKLDRYGNDVPPKQKLYHRWQKVPLADSARLYATGLKFYLEEGMNIFSFKKNSGNVLLKEIIISPTPQYPNYEDYLQLTASSLGSGVFRHEAENIKYKNSSAIIRGTVRDVGVLPFSKNALKLNVLGIDSYQEPGEQVTWEVDIPEPGYYQISFKVMQNRQYTTTYRSIYVNGELPFQEASNLMFSYHRNWQNVTLSDNNGNPYLFYLEPTDTITMVVNSELFTDISIKIRTISDEIAKLGLDVTKLTHNNIDKGIDWDIILHFPNIHNDIDQWIIGMEDIISVLTNLYGFKSKSQIIQDVNLAINKIKTIANNINELPRRLSLLSQGPSCAVQLLANHIDAVLHQPLIIDALFIHGEENLPSPTGTFFKRVSVGISRFFQSFFNRKDIVRKGELEVWVNRSRPYVDIIQRIVDNDFTSKTGISVKVSLMSNDSKLILANSAKKGPDVALGVSAWIPHEYGMRGMLTDLTGFDNFQSVLSWYNPEQLIPMVYDGSLYGLPETENFYVLLYRKDILDKLNISIPNTWDDVIGLLPVLNRYGMSFYLPLSNMSSSKSFDTTAPFIFQHRGLLYTNDSFAGGIDAEETIVALTLMTDFYRQYGIPHQIPSFFNSFRQQTVPIGIADFGTYLQLINAAAEIRGLWDIALVPGVADQDGVINRSMPGAQQAGIIFKSSKYQSEAWEFLKWWMETDTQVLYADTMLFTLGSKYLWNTANLEAFSKLNWQTSHKNIILDQWSHLKEVPKIPGSYMVERELSNIWNRVVYDDINLRSAISDSLLIINKEINRKMKEFGYIDNNDLILKPYQLPTIDIILGWLDDE